MDFEEDHNEDGDNEQRVKLAACKRITGPCDELTHQARRIERRRGLENNPEALAIRTESLDIIGQRFVIAPLPGGRACRLSQARVG